MVEETTSEIPTNNEAEHTAHHHADHEHGSHHHLESEHHEHNKKKGMDIMALIKENQLYIEIFFLFLAISLVMFWPVTINIGSAIRNGYGDAYQSLFNLWWFPHAIFTLHQSPYFTYLLHFPIGSNLATQTLSPIAGILLSPIYGLSPAFSYNLLFFLAFALSGLFMFIFADHIVQNKYAALIAGIIYAFSPMHIAQATAHLDWTMIEWIPLFILFYMLALREKKVKYALIAAVCFVLLTFMGDIQQGIMVFFFALILTVLMLIFERKDLINVGTFKNLGLFIVFTLIISSPLLILLLPNITGSALSVAQQNSGVVSNMQWSDNLASFFLPSYYNGIFQSLSTGYSSTIYQLTYQGSIYAINIGERVSYIGYSVLILSLIGLYFDFKNNKFKHTAIWIIIAVIFGMLALGPYVQIYSTVTNIPTIYLLFRQIPILNIIREPGRFDVIITICLAIFAALGFAQLVKGKDRNTARIYAIAVALIILIEYNGMPLTSTYISNFTESTIVPSAYYAIGNSTGNFSMLFIPALPNDSSTPNAYTGLATYYTVVTKHPLVGGYTSRTNDTQTLSEDSIPLVAASTYLQEGYGLVYPSPIVENYSNVTLLFLANYQTEFVSEIRPAYNESEQYALYSYLEDSFGQPVYVSNSTFIFSTADAISKDAERSLVAYTVGADWIPGYEFCSPYQPCNANISSMWWGNNTRAIVLFSPVQGRVQMGMIATSPINGTPLGIFVNGNSAGNVALRTQQYAYDINLTVPAGLSQIIFYSQNSSEQVGPYFAYGIRNITFTT